MEFRVLGPLEVRVGERVLPLTGARQRTVLAFLLLRAGDVVSSDRLIDELWAERPPRSGIDALQVCVSRLRKVLPEGTVVTEARGYRLAVSGEQIDAGRFERLAGEGRAALADGDPKRSALLLREALDLWNGPALADFAYEPFAQGEIARLEELRSSRAGGARGGRAWVWAFRRAGRRARGAHPRSSAARAAARAADAGPVSLRPSGGGSGGIPGGAARAGRRAGHRAEPGPARPRARDPRTGSGARRRAACDGRSAGAYGAAHHA